MKLNSISVVVALAVGILVGLALLRRPARAQDDTVTDEPEDKDYVTLPNPSPILTPELLPGFRLSVSRISRDLSRRPPTEFFTEHWHSDPPMDSVRTLVRITLYRLQDQPDAFRAAKDVFHATPGANSAVIGTPQAGSYTGQPIGDYCWAFKGSQVFPGRMKTTRSLVVIKDANLFDLMVTNRAKDPGVEFTEEVARAIISRL